MRALSAGIAYGALIFALGFILGAARELWLAPAFGRETIVLLEAPLILLGAWLVARWLVRRMRVPAQLGPRLIMGLLAFALLMLGEAAVAVLAMGRTLPMHLAGYMTMRGTLELMPQIAFGLFPALHLLRERP